MSVTDVILAVEDELSEVVSAKILKQFNISIRNTIIGKGNISLRQKAPEFNRSANGIGIFLLTDLDSPQDCLQYSFILGLEAHSIQGSCFAWQSWKWNLG